MDNGNGLKKPILALTNIFDQDAEALARFAVVHGFEGIDWSFALEEEESDFLARARLLQDFEVRYHCRFPKVDLAYADERSEYAMGVLRRCVRFASLAGGRFVTVHIGLGLHVDEELDWGKAVSNLTLLTRYAKDYGVTVCLENLPALWTSDPGRFATLIAEAGTGVTVDIGHTEFCRGRAPGLTCERYIMPHAESIFNAHIYHREIPGMGHLAPEDLEDIRGRLEDLTFAPNCNWWVIELAGADETIKTREILSGYVAGSLAVPSGRVTKNGIRV